jgi:hypothetical protein
MSACYKHATVAASPSLSLSLSLSRTPMRLSLSLSHFTRGERVCSVGQRRMNRFVKSRQRRSEFYEKKNLPSVEITKSVENWKLKIELLFNKKSFFVVVSVNSDLKTVWRCWVKKKKLKKWFEIELIELKIVVKMNYSNWTFSEKSFLKKQFLEKMSFLLKIFVLIFGLLPLPAPASILRIDSDRMYSRLTVKIGDQVQTFINLSAVFNLLRGQES